MSENKEHIEKKNWNLRDFRGQEISFFPVFVVQDLKDGQVMLGTNQEVECKQVHIEMKNKAGDIQNYDIGFQELFMFVYYAANEEMRRNLQLQREKKISHIPYEVTFRLSQDEIGAGMAKRLIQLPVDDIIMSIARSEAQLIAGIHTKGTIEEYFHNKSLQKKRSILNKN